VTGPTDLSEARIAVPIGPSINVSPTKFVTGKAASEAPFVVASTEHAVDPTGLLDSTEDGQSSDRGRIT